MSILKVFQDSADPLLFREVTDLNELEEEFVIVGGQYTPFAQYSGYIFEKTDKSGFVAVYQTPTGWSIADSSTKDGTYLPVRGTFTHRDVVGAMASVDSLGLSDLSHYLPSGNIARATPDQLIEYESSLLNTSKKVSSTARPKLPPIKHVVNGKGVGDFEGDGTFFKIGPHVYGGEVQDVKIVEHKAVQAIQGVRSNSDFLVEDGQGEAYVEVTMLFDGRDAIIKNFLPLVALFRVSPITTVKNDVVNGALYDDFTEDNSEGSQDIVENELDSLVEEAYRERKHQRFFDAMGGVGTIVDEETFNFFKKTQPTNPIFDMYPDFSAFDNDLASYIDDEASVNSDTEDVSSQTALDQAQRSRINRKKDLSGFVPVAFTKLAVQTHPEFPEALIAKLFLKRIDASNYLRDYVQYRTSGNTPTADAANAYWL
ncbi:MAG: hypothetical protein ACXABY_16955, partial [Candidatus Thorarchaeota archaeon]